MKSQDEILQEFKEDMQTELYANDHKGDWRKFINGWDIILELDHHEKKLYQAIHDKDKKLIREHIADCANLLMMLGNAHGLYE